MIRLIQRGVENVVIVMSIKLFEYEFEKSKLYMLNRRHVSFLLLVYLHLALSKLLMPSCPFTPTPSSLSFLFLIRLRLFLSLTYFFFPTFLFFPFLPLCCCFLPSCQPPWQVIQTLWALRPALPKWWMLAELELFQVFLWCFLLTATQQHCISTDAGSSSMIPGAALITCIIRLTDTSQTQA